MRCPSGDQASPPIVLFSSTSKTFRACCPSGRITQISRSPYLPTFVSKERKEPSGEKESPVASSRILWGGLPETEKIQMLQPWEVPKVVSPPSGQALARKPLLSGSQAPTPKPSRWLLTSSGRGIACV